jgi:5-carboxymethyl-2-hydroxymuconate isomerase
MPHIVVLYTGNLEGETDMPALCRALARTLIEQRDEDGKAVFPRGGTRVFAYPSAHHAVADGDADDDYGFVYLNLRMARGRSSDVKQRTGDALVAVTRQHVEPLLERRRVGVTLQIDESPGQVYDAKLGNLHDLYR